MPKAETIQSFAKSMHKFPLVLQNRMVKNWDDYTQEVFASSQNKVPILSGDLLRSGGFKKAKITANGIESSITYSMPYSNYIEGGLNKDGSSINYLAAGLKSGGYTKSRKGGPNFLGSSVDDNVDDVMAAMKKSVGEAWRLV